MNDLIKVIKPVETIINPVYLVGGSVRDSQLGITPHDFDFATPLLPNEIEKRVKAAGRHAYTIGKKFGTIGFKLDGKYIEVTTFRTETYSENNRKPSVEFVDDLMVDLSRRDFTINAMAIELKNNQPHIIDPFGGQIDTENRLIRAVGNARERIKEDPLRMLRAARFVAQFGFNVDVDLMTQIKRRASTIYNVSRERWVTELDKLLTSKHAGQGLQVLADSNLLRYILPELWLQVGFDQNSPYHNLELWEHTKKVVDLSPNETDIRWAALFHDVGKPFAQTKNAKGYSNYIMHEIISAEIVGGIAHRLKWSKARTEAVTALVRRHMDADSPLRNADDATK
ncbi:MAG: CCA tRNA nucleotidyltransferase [Candidatus Nomurabacteria bacterium]|jgi:tRNA nucleotidyltransferase/poly(A) polymerase|nr:CCA tRNA nucleotidyltransferase [Candidatus Nomurabacteria bacterium]